MCAVESDEVLKEKPWAVSSPQLAVGVSASAAIALCFEPGSDPQDSQAPEGRTAETVRTEFRSSPSAESAVELT